MTSRHLVFGLVFLSSVFSCSQMDPNNPHHDVVKDEHLKPSHGGKLVEGDDYIIEVVSTEEQVTIYPMKYNQKKNKLENLPLDEVDMLATYSYLERVKGEGTKGRPTTKSEASIPLEATETAFVGKVDAQKTDAYLLNVKMKYKNEKEKYRHEVQL